MTQPQEKQNYVSAFLVLFLLIAASVVVGFLARNALFAFLDGYAREVGTFIIYTGFVIVSLIAAVVMFGVMRSTGIFRRTSKQGKYEYGGAMAGFLILLFFLIQTYEGHTRLPPVLQVSGNIRFVENGIPVGPVQGAKIALSRRSGFETDSDRNGNFTLQLPEQGQLEEIVLQITYAGKTDYQTVRRTEVNKIQIEIPKSKQEGNLEPFTEGTFGILVLPFEGSTTEEQEKGVKIQGTITKTLSARLRELHIDDAEVRATPIFMALPPHTHADTRRFGDTYHAALVIWGDITLAGLIPNLTIVHPLPTSVLQPETTMLKDTLTHAQLTNIQDIRLPALTEESTLFVAFVTGLKYYQESKYDRAIKYFTLSLPGSPTRYIDTIPIFFFRGNAFFFATKYEDAIADYKTALNLNPEFAEAYINRSAVYTIQGDYARATADYKTALNLNPDDADVYNIRGNIYSYQGNYDQAIADYTTAIKLNPENAVAYNNRGNDYGAQRNYDQAIADYTTAINLNPEFADAYYNRGIAYSALRNYDQAIADYTTAIKLNPKFADAYINKASTYQRMGNITGALEAYRGFIQYAPPHEVLKIDSVKQKIKELEQHEHMKIPSQPSRQ
jgi:tetratricopeptide (TPR) repeat protein